MLAISSARVFGDLLTPITVQLKWDHQFQFAGFYAAISQGYYKEAGYDVRLVPRINPDGSFKDTFGELKSGRAQFAVAGPDVLKLLDSGEQVAVVASYYQKSPYVYVSLSRDDITGITDIHESCISSSHDFGELELKTVFRNEGLSIENLHIEDFRFALSSLLDGSCPVVIDYKISAIWAAQEKDLKINMIEAGDYGIHFYGDTLYTLTKTIEADPHMVDAFNKATNRGWEYALENPEEISRFIVQNYPRVLVYDNPYEYNLFSAGQIRLLMNYPVTEVGHSNPHRWQQLQDYLYDLGVVSDRQLSEGFIFNYQDIVERSQNEKYRYAVLVVLILVVVVVVLVYFQYKKTKREKEYIRERQRLLEGSDLLRSVLDLIPVGVYWKDDRLRFLGCNKRFLRDSGFESFEDIVGKSDLDMPWRDDAIAIQKQDQEVLAGRFDSSPFEGKLIGVDGVSWVQARKMPLKSINDKVLGVLGVYQDITDYKSVIEQLNSQNSLINESNQKLSQLIDSSPDIIVYREYQEDRLIISVYNHMFEKWVGDLTDEKDCVFSKEVLSVLEEKDSVVVRELDQVLYKAESSLSDGRRVLLDIVKVPVFSDLNIVKGILFIGRDVTETRELQSLYEALFSLTQDPFFVIDEVGAISSCNDAGAQILGLENRTNLIGMRLIEHFTPEYQPDGERSESKVKRVNESVEKASDARVQFDFTHKDIDGNPIHVRVFIVRLNGGPKKRLLVQWHDIKDMYAREESLRQAKADAEELADQKSMFLANMSHEIRTPLNALVGLSNLLVANETHVKAQDYMRSINKASIHLKSIVDDILDFSKIDADRIDLDEIAVNFDEFLCEIKSLHEQSAREKGLHFEVDNRLDNDIAIVIDPVRYRQIINNLVSNAIKFTEKGEVIVVTKKQQESLLLSVCDTGCGLDENQLSNLFDPFSQADITTTRKYGGTGLGLSICKGLAERMSGSISVSSELGKGSCFYVSIPYKSESNALPANKMLNIPDFTGKNILIAEDNRMNQMVIEGLLEDTHCKVIFANNGKEAVDLYESSNNSIDVILMDIQMPVMDGYQSTRALKAIPDFDVPIIALTANADNVDKQRCYVEGMADFLSKPVDQTQLYESLKRILI
ncbi:multi-sensor hybrid histidine kinase [Oceanobacter sp. RED65]|uniref:histidine kinase n=2 Tax=Bermanella marisrubri TaxID=207949 RepID=Q1N4U1_9GAMM|nr:multi-sensor hybrid histidine kinase [Oceanobacter sp. RED65] [Bermanella marisrubri]